MFPNKFLTHFKLKWTYLRTLWKKNISLSNISQCIFEINWIKHIWELSGKQIWVSGSQPKRCIMFWSSDCIFKECCCFVMSQHCFIDQDVRIQWKQARLPISPVKAQSQRSMCYFNYCKIKPPVKSHSAARYYTLHIVHHWEQSRTEYSDVKGTLNQTNTVTYC